MFSRSFLLPLLLLSSFFLSVTGSRNPFLAADSFPSSNAAHSSPYFIWLIVGIIVMGLFSCGFCVVMALWVNNEDFKELQTELEKEKRQFEDEILKQVREKKKKQQQMELENNGSKTKRKQVQSSSPPPVTSSPYVEEVDSEDDEEAAALLAEGEEILANLSSASSPSPSPFENGALSSPSPSGSDGVPEDENSPSSSSSFTLSQAAYSTLSPRSRSKRVQHGSNGADIPNLSLSSSSSSSSKSPSNPPVSSPSTRPVITPISSPKDSSSSSSSITPATSSAAALKKQFNFGHSITSPSPQEQKKSAGKKDS